MGNAPCETCNKKPISRNGLRNASEYRTASATKDLSQNTRPIVTPAPMASAKQPAANNMRFHRSRRRVIPFTGGQAGVGRPADNASRISLTLPASKLLSSSSLRIRQSPSGVRVRRPASPFESWARRRGCNSGSSAPSPGRPLAFSVVLPCRVRRQGAQSALSADTTAACRSPAPVSSCSALGPNAGTAPAPAV